MAKKRRGRSRGKGRAKSPGKRKPHKARVYTLSVRLIGGPVREEFVKENPIVRRVIEIRSDQTLKVLHEAIYRAFGRWDDHLYEFQMSDEPADYAAPYYELILDDVARFLRQKPTGDVGKTRLRQLGLDAGDVFHYWFDFGDDWWHRIEVKSTDGEADDNPYPRVIEEVGESPSQYLWQDVLEEEDDE